MADSNNQTDVNQAPVQESSNNMPATPKSIVSISSSPWEDELDLPEAPPKSNPAVIGSLEPKDSAETEQPVPFNVPENIEDKVGQKVPAQNYIGQKEQDIPPTNIPPTNPTIPQMNPVQAQAVTTSEPVLPPEPAGVNQAVNLDVPKPKKGIFGSVFGRFSRPKKEVLPSAAIASPPIPTTAEPSEALVDKGLLPERQASAVQPAKDLTPAKKTSFVFNGRLASVLGIFVFFAFLVGLTELGLLSVGVEKIYGAIGLERIWGGLSTNPESSFVKSAALMQKHPNFKMKGTITMSVDSSIKSQITSPLLSAIESQTRYAKKDSNIANPVKAIKTATDNSADIYNMYDNATSGTGSTDSSTSTDSSSGTSTNSTSSNASSTATDSTTGNSAASTETSNIQEVKASFQTKSNKDGIETSINVDSVSDSSNIDLLLKGGNLLVKSSAFKFDTSAVADKWLSYTLSGLKGKSLQNDFFKLDTQSGLSIKGKRSSNEKIGNTRCYNYKIDSIEIGNSLSSLGITSDIIQNISGNIWIGINDKLIRKADLKIITPVSSSASTINISLEFSDFDLENKITFPDVTEIVAASTTGTSGAGGTSNQTITARDAQRKSDVNKLLEALKKYKNDNGNYPISKDLLKLNATDNIIMKALVPKYISSWPADPTEGWYYAYKSDGKKCSISARLEDVKDSEGQLLNGVFLYLKYNNE